MSDLPRGNLNNDGPHEFGVGIELSPTAMYWRGRSQVWMRRAIELGWECESDSQESLGPVTIYKKQNPVINIFHKKGHPVAYLHTVVQDDGTADLALSFKSDSFPLEGVGGFRSVRAEPLFYGDDSETSNP